MLTTHSAVCPCTDCLRETRVGLIEDEVIVYGSCSHLAGVERNKDEIAVLFQEKQP